MPDFLAKSPSEWEMILGNVKDFLSDNLPEIKSLRFVQRCHNCFKKVSDITVQIDNDSLTITDWSYNCNNNKSYSHSLTIGGFNPERLLFSIKKDKQWDLGFALEMIYYMGAEYKINITPYYTDKDYLIHGVMAYKDRNLKLIQREVDSGLVIMLQNFIDFEGLMPKFSETILVTFKDEEDDSKELNE